jgi:hypothetical protein
MSIGAASLPRRRFRWRVVLVMTVVFLLTLRVFDSSARSDQRANRFTLASDQTVFDASTGLTWQRKLDERACATDVCTWERALAYCDALSLDGGGFRLPTRQELVVVMDSSRSQDHGADWGTFSAEDYFWTASAAAVNPEGARFPSLSYSASVADAVHRLRVRCVR